MPKYDAFGREIGEDPLANLRDATAAEPAERAQTRVEPLETRVESTADPEPVLWPDPEPVVARAETPVEAAPSPRPTFARPRRRRRGGLATLLVLGAVVGAVGLVAGSVVQEGQDIIDRIQIPDADPAPPPAAVGLQERSLIRADNFSDALEQLESSGLGRPTIIRIAPDRINATLLSGGRVHSVQITPDGELKDFGEGAGSGKPIPYAAIDPAAPDRLVRAAATGKHPIRSIDYVLVNPAPPATGAYFKGGRIVLGDRHGRPQRVIAN